MAWVKQGNIKGADGGAGASYGGQWRADTPPLFGSTQSFSHETVTNILLNTAIGTPSGITNNNNGTWTINQTGLWTFSLTADLNFATAPTSPNAQEWIIKVTGPNGTIAACQFVWVSNAWTDGTASGMARINSGQTVTCIGVWYRSGGTTGGPFNLVDVARTNFTAQKIAD